MKRLFLILLVAVLFASGLAHAQNAKNESMGKLATSLVSLHEQHAAHFARRSAAPFQSRDPLVKVVDDRVIIDAVASGDVGILKSQLESLGMQDTVAFGRFVSGQLPVSALPAAAELASLRFAQPAAAGRRAGAVTSQGDQAMVSNSARANFGVDGSGVKVGALSDSFNCLGGASSNVSNGDLSSVTVVQEISSCLDATDEGRAMLQIVHDVAPGAALAFASAFNGMASFANNIIALKNNGAKVIVDDVFYFAEPMFQDGIIAQAVDTVVGSGVAYFSAAGNEANQSYESVFRSGSSFADGAIPSAAGAPHFFGGTAHNFDPGGGTDHFQSITIPAHGEIQFSLQWDSPFFSVSGGPGSPNDLDIYLLNASATQVLAGGANDNVGGDAVEVFSYTNNTNAPVTVNLMIVKFFGGNPGLIKYVRFGSATINEFDTQSSTIFGHGNAAGAEAVGAARYSQTPAFGVSPPVLEFFSSAGGTPILFDVNGNPVSDPRADKPEIVAPDGVNTTFFFPGDDFEPDGFPNFFGTSAAAPHAAAVAALMLDLNPALTPTALYGILESTAIDMGAPGFDNDTGFGLIQADTALAAVPVPVPLVVGAGSLPDGEVQRPYNGDLLVSGGAPPYNVSATAGSPPSGLNISSNGTVSGTPTKANSKKPKSFTVRVADNLGSVVLKSFTIKILAAVAIKTKKLPKGTAGQVYSGTLTPTGGKPSYSWSVAAGSLPAGLSLNPSTGAITGTPAAAGVFGVTFRAVDALGGTAQRTYTITIN